MISRGDLMVYDLTLSRSVEQIKFNGISPAIPDGDGTKSPEQDQVEHTFRVYKGKLFLLVRRNLLRSNPSSDAQKATG